MHHPRRRYNGCTDIKALSELLKPLRPGDHIAITWSPGRRGGSANSSLQTPQEIPGYHTATLGDVSLPFRLFEHKLTIFHINFDHVTNAEPARQEFLGQRVLD